MQKHPWPLHLPPAQQEDGEVEIGISSAQKLDMLRLGCVGLAVISYVHMCCPSPRG